MNFRIVIKILNKSLREKQPKEFSCSWILKNEPGVYRRLRKNVRTENNDIDWDRVTSKLTRKFQKRWARYKRKTVKEYQNQTEVDLILSKYKDKLYTLIVTNDVGGEHHR